MQQKRLIIAYRSYLKDIFKDNHKRAERNLAQLKQDPYLAANL